MSMSIKGMVAKGCKKADRMPKPLREERGPRILAVTKQAMFSLAVCLSLAEKSL